MAKIKKQYKCSNCGHIEPNWMGQCKECNEWNTLVLEELKPEVKGAVARGGYGYTGSIDNSWKNINAITAQEEGTRFDTCIHELNRVLGGGIVQGSTILLAGSPGAGKSTLLLQMASYLSQQLNVGIISGEESGSQIKGRSDRLGLVNKNLSISTNTDVTNIQKILEKEKMDILIVDSIASMFHPELETAPGSANQLKTCCVFLNKMAKTHNCSIVIIGHITKDYEIAGPKSIEHVVDVVLDFFPTDDNRYRMLKASKNRFGRIEEVGIFKMEQDGLKGVDNPSSIFLNRVLEQATGSIITPLWEGTRPLLIEIQVLMDKSISGHARRVSVGIDDKRIAMLIAILNKHSGIQAYDYDVYVNIAGGIKVNNTSVDLAVIMAAISSFLNIVIPSDTIALGEVGLSGEIKPVPNAEERMKEAARLGYKKAYVPSENWKGKNTVGTMEIIPMVSIQEIITHLK
jgi:DNA repair protein RadA/Sms